jgi:AcrR family transcriptional regulator
MLPEVRQSHMSTTARPNRSRAAQTRSKATVQRIIDSTIALTMEKGTEPVTMTEIAQRADIVIGAVYRYFEDKSAINRAILLQHNSYMEERIKRHLVNITDADAFIHAMLAIYQMYDESRSRDPMFGSLWSIVQGDTSLQTIETQATLKNASHLLAEAKKHFPGANDDELMASCVFALQLSATASHLNRTMPKALARQMSQTHEQAITNALNALR